MPIKINQSFQEYIDALSRGQPWNQPILAEGPPGYPFQLSGLDLFGTGISPFGFGPAPGLPYDPMFREIPSLTPTPSPTPIPLPQATAPQGLFSASGPLVVPSTPTPEPQTTVPQGLTTAYGPLAAPFLSTGPARVPPAAYGPTPQGPPSPGTPRTPPFVGPMSADRLGATMQRPGAVPQRPGAAPSPKVPGKPSATSEADRERARLLQWKDTVGKMGMNWNVLVQVYLDPARNGSGTTDSGFREGINEMYKDGKWAELFAKYNNGRAPNEAEWNEHYYFKTEGARDPLLEPGHPEAIQEWKRMIEEQNRVVYDPIIEETLD